MAARSNARSNARAKKTTRTAPRKAGATRKAASVPAPAAEASAAELRARLGLTRPVFARLVGSSERTIADWERADSPKPASERALKELRSVIDACERVMKPEFVGKWLVAPNDMLDGFKPIERIERGETEKVLRVLFFVEAGIPL